MIYFLTSLKNILANEYKTYFFYLFIFSIAIAVIETVGISVVMPYITLANDFTLLEQNNYYSKVYHILNFSNPIDFLLTMGLAVILFYIMRAILNVIYHHLVIKFTFITYHFIANRLFANYLCMPYTQFIQKNKSTLTKVIVQEAGNFTDMLRALLIFSSELFIFLFIYTTLLYINYQIAFAFTALLGISSFIMLKTISKTVKTKGVEREIFQKDFFELLNRNFSNAKMIKMHAVENVLNDFSNVSKAYAEANIVSFSYQNFPRLILEAIGFSSIIMIIMSIIFFSRNDISSSYGLITVFILGLYRLMPSATRIMLSFNQILFYHKSLELIHEDLQIEIEDHHNEQIQFNKFIELSNISFCYNSDQNIISNVNLTIQKNEHIAFVGESGSGKSTLVDIIMGLHAASDGKIVIDGVNELSKYNMNHWRNHFGYIPQHVYLFDGSVAQNVAFGSDIDEEKVIKALQQANIWETIQSKGGLSVLVGESGVLLSGGQKQRIAIARALYKDPDILVLDEATSALDDETELKIMNELYDLAKNKTLIVIAHRLSTIRRCQTVYEVSSQNIRKIG